MKFTLRLVSAIWLSVMLVIGIFAYLQIREERGRLVGDLQRRAMLITEGLSDAIEASSAKQSPAAIERLVKKFGQAQRGVVVYDRFATLRFASPDVAPILPPSLPEVTEAISRNSPTQGFRVLGDRSRFIYATPLMADDQPVGAIAVLQDASHLERAEWDRWSYNAVRFLVLALVISVIIALIVKFSITRPMAEISQWTRALRSGRPVPPPRNVSDANMFGPLALEVSRLARSMQRAQAAAGLAHQGRGAGILFRLLQRGAVAALPHRAHPAGVPTRRLGLLPRGEPEVRRHGAGPDQGRRIAAGADPGLPLRAAVGAHQGRAPRRARRDLLAHPVAELRGFRDLPLAARALARHARRRPDRVPHPVLLQQLPGDGRPHARGAHRLGALRGDARRAHDVCEAVPDQRRPRVRRRSAARLPGRAAARAGDHGRVSRGGRRAHRLHDGPAGAA